MPFYEYQCAACGRHHEELQKVGDRALRKCPACGRSSLRRLVSAPVFRLKGGGWYETDFKADKEQQRNLAGDKEPAPEPGPAAAKPAENKPEKAEAKPEAAKADKPAAPAAARPGAAAVKPVRARRPARRRRH
ncbi:MAG TPA: zinc ribbon domain-containing protein [Steroidobacteraceae bacterium]|nr:zinc ribbon domain-containing protein [Steroidobacteraceae bacterium]